MTVAIVGAGIAGLSVAHALLRRGVRPVVHARDHGATARGSGIVSAQFWDRTLLPLALRSREIIASLVPVHRVGMTQIALSRRTAREVARLGGAEPPAALLRCMRPSFVDRIQRASFSRDEFWVDSAALIEALSRGVTIVRSMRIRAARVVLATGASTPGARVERAALARASVRVPTMFHVLDTGLYMRDDLAGDTTIANIRRCMHETLGASVCFLRAGRVAMKRRPIVRRRGDTWTVGGFGGDGLALAPAIGEQIAESLLTS